MITASSRRLCRNTFFAMKVVSVVYIFSYAERKMPSVGAASCVGRAYKYLSYGGCVIRSESRWTALCLSLSEWEWASRATNARRRRKSKPPTPSCVWMFTVVRSHNNILIVIVIRCLSRWITLARSLRFRVELNMWMIIVAVGHIMLFFSSFYIFNATFHFYLRAINTP